MDNSRTARLLALDIRERLPNGGLLCLTGLGASGKSTFARELVEALGPEEAAKYRFDDLYWDTEQRRKTKGTDGEDITGCHPLSVYDPLARKVLEDLKKRLDVPVFSTKNDQLVHWPVGTYENRRFNIVDGLAAALGGRERLYDLLIFMDCDLQTEEKRRFSRDVNARKKKPKDVKEIFLKRRAQYEKYVLPIKDQADFILTSSPNYKVELLPASAKKQGPETPSSPR